MMNMLTTMSLLGCVSSLPTPHMRINIWRHLYQENLISKRPASLRGPPRPKCEKNDFCTQSHNYPNSAVLKAVGNNKFVVPLLTRHRDTRWAF